MTALIGLLTGKKYSRASVGAVFLDVTINEEHSYTSKATQFPIENGEFISDHVIKDPITLSLSGIVSDSPLSILALFNRSQDAFTRLVRIYDLKEKITVVTGLKIYENMIMTALKIPRNLETGESLNFNMEFQQIITDTTTILNINEPFRQRESVILRDQVATNENIPIHQNDPKLTLKDQSQSPFNLGIQTLRVIPQNILRAIV